MIAIFGQVGDPGCGDEEWYAQVLSRIGTTILPGYGNIYVYDKEGSP